MMLNWTEQNNYKGEISYYLQTGELNVSLYRRSLSLCYYMECAELDLYGVQLQSDNPKSEAIQKIKETIAFQQENLNKMAQSLIAKSNKNG